MKWYQLISHIICSWLTYLTIHGINWMLSMLQQRALNYLSVSNLWCIGIRRPHKHFELKRMKKLKATMSRCTGESSICQESREHTLSPECLPMLFGIIDKWLAHAEQCRSIHWHTVKIQVYWTIVSICHKLRYGSSRRANMSIPFGTKTL